MTQSFAAPSCSVEVYPFEGGPFVLGSGQIRSVTVEKSIRGGSVGRARIDLAPGGPFGVESSPTWTEVITPMSHVLIGMSRGDKAAIVLDGVSTRSSEEQDFRSSIEESGAGRFPVVEVADFAWFFRTFNWYSLTFLGLTAGAPVGEALGFAPAGIPALLDQGLLGGTGTNQSNPSLVAQRWFDKVMAGQGAILGKTFVPYNGSRVPFGQAVATTWENYPNAFIPFADYFMAAEESWMDKFMEILPMPWYEFFVTTAPSGAYAMASGSTGVTSSGATFTMASQPLALPAGPQLVARINPIPTLSVTSDTSAQNTSIGTLDVSRWNALPVNEPDPLNSSGAPVFYSSEVTFSAEAARNFYMLNPTAYTSLFGNNNSNNIPFPFSFVGAADPASVHRYGFRPEIGTFKWLFDPQGTAGQNADLNIPQSVAALLGKLISWCHPEPLMARGTVTLPLSPDIMIGTRWRYAPFKDGTLWDFYVETVRHHFVFGGVSTTTLALTRGLPSSVYSDASSDGVLQAIFTGNAMRMNGAYASGVPDGTGPALTTFGSPESITTLMGRLANIFVTPQAPGQ